MRSRQPSGEYSVMRCNVVKVLFDVRWKILGVDRQVDINRNQRLLFHELLRTCHDHLNSLDREHFFERMIRHFMSITSAKICLSGLPPGSSMVPEHIITMPQNIVQRLRQHGTIKYFGRLRQAYMHVDTSRAPEERNWDMDVQVYAHGISVKFSLNINQNLCTCTIWSQLCKISDKNLYTNLNVSTLQYITKWRSTQLFVSYSFLLNLLCDIVFHKFISAAPDLGLQVCANLCGTVCCLYYAILEVVHWLSACFS
ncbi:hypothetical protein V1506DRAFT_167957 [Lipomyces tetrasporus]